MKLINLIKPEIYDKLFREEQFAKYDCIMRLISNKHKETLIDIGCGTGLLIEYIGEYTDFVYERYVCMDPDIEMLFIATSKTTSYRVIFIQAYAEDDSLREGSGDVVVSISTWGALSDKPDALKTLKNTARVNGLVILTGHPRTYSRPPSHFDQDYIYAENCIDDIYIARPRQQSDNETCSCSSQ